jgi:signal transduction histidine kinase
MRRLRLGIILTALILVTSAPLAGVAAWLTWNSGRQQRDLVDAQNVERVRAVSAAIDLEIERTTGGLLALTTLEPIDLDDLSHFTQIARRMLSIHPSWQSVRLIDRDLRVVADTDPALPVLVHPEWARQILDTGKPTVSTVRKDLPTGQYVVNVGVPVMRGGQGRYVLAARIRASSFSELLRKQQPPEGGVITILDAVQTIMARTRNEERYVGGRPTKDFVERSRSQQSGNWRSVLLEGTPSYSAWHRSDLTGWTVGLGMPAETIDGPVRRRTTAIVLVSVATLGMGLIVALFLGRGIVRAQVAAAGSARALARGEPVPIVHSHITEADDLGRALHGAAKILEQRIMERDAAAAALNRAKDNFIATVSHELRTPLNAIYGWVAMLRTGSLDKERQAKALDVIERNARAQSQVVEDLLDMSSIIHGRLRLAEEPVDLSRIVRTAVDMVAPASRENRASVTIHADAPAIVIGDPSRLQQIVWNLVANAMKFTPPKGRIEVSVTTDAEDAIIRVTDDGEGIAPEFLPYVFDRFRQEIDNVTRQHSGLGIGLALARTLTEMHGGTIHAESAGKGAGATFTVRLPLRQYGAGSGEPSPRDRREVSQI